MGETFHFQVNLGGMLDILSNHLYKTPDVFIRELLQNGVDAITQRKHIQKNWNNGNIHIKVEENQKIIFKDNGSGLNEDEIHHFLAIIGQSSKHDLTNSYESEDFIGRFGIGLLSCFMVSDVIEVHTKSIDGSPAYIWKGFPDGTYTLEQANASSLEADAQTTDAGTTIILYSKMDSQKYFNAEKLWKLVQYYGLTLPIPVYMNDCSEPINNMPQEFTQLGQRQLLAFGEWIFDEAFLDAIPIETPHLSGAAFILPYQTDVSVKKSHRIYLKHMLLTEESTPLLPDWAFFVKCCLNTAGLRPTASRENFYEDDELQLAKQEFLIAVKQYFKKLSIKNSDLMIKIVHIHLTAIKSMSVWDNDIFELFIDYLPFETSEGTVTGAYLKTAGPAVYVSDVPKFKQLKSIFFQQEQLLICTGYASDEELINKLKQRYMLPIEPMREEDMSLVLDDIFPAEKMEAGFMIAELNKALNQFDCQADLKRFYPSDLPALYCISNDVLFIRQIQGAKETSKGIFSDTLSSLLSGRADEPLSTLYFNMNNPLIKEMLHITDDRLLHALGKILYVNAMVTGGQPLHQAELKALNSELLYMITTKLKHIGDENE